MEIKLGFIFFVFIVGFIIGIWIGDLIDHIYAVLKIDLSKKREE